MRNLKRETKCLNNMYSPPHPQKLKMMLRKPKLHFGLQEPGICQISWILLEPPNGVNRSAASDINAESSPFSIFILFFRRVFQIILTKTNRYLHQYMSSRTTGSTSAQPSDITIKEMYTFLRLVIQMGHDHHHSLKDYWSREEQYCTPCYSNAMAHDRFLHILRFLHFEDNDNPPNHDDPDYDRLWKIRKIFDTLKNKFCELYNLTEQLAVDEVIVLYKGRVFFFGNIFQSNIKVLASKFTNFATLWATLMMWVCI